MQNLLILIIVLLLGVFTASIESFGSYMSSPHQLPITKQFTKTHNIRPRQALPPGITNINKKFKNSGMVFNKSEYCEDNPTCYPCPNWKHIGAPVCLA